MWTGEWPSSEPKEPDDGEDVLDCLHGMDGDVFPIGETAGQCDTRVPEYLSLDIEAPWDAIRDAIRFAGYEATDERL